MKIKVDFREMPGTFVVLDDDRGYLHLEMSQAEKDRLRAAEREYFAIQDILRERMEKALKSGEAITDMGGAGDTTVITGI